MDDTDRTDVEWIMEQVAEEICQEPVNASPFIPVPRGLTRGKSRMIRDALEALGIEVVDIQLEGE